MFDYTDILLLIILLIFLLQFEMKFMIIISIGLFIIYKFFVNYSVNDISQNTLQSLLKDIDKYKNINIDSYKLGLKYFNLFHKDISNVDDLNIYDKKELYLNKSIDYFNNIYLINMDINYKYLIDSLNNYGLNLLKNISNKLNKKWEDNPNITMRQIIFNEPLPHNVK